MAAAVVAPPLLPVPLWFAPRRLMEIDPLSVRLPVQYTTTNNFRTVGITVMPELMVSAPLTTTKALRVSCVAVNQSVAVKAEIVCAPCLTQKSYDPSDTPLMVSVPPAVGVDDVV